MITIDIIFSDEEIGGNDGMEQLVQQEIFKKMNVKFALDEGYANPDENMFVFYGERVPACKLRIIYMYCVI